MVRPYLKVPQIFVVVFGILILLPFGVFAQTLVANPDSVVMDQGTEVLINVIANDTLDGSSYSGPALLVSGPSNGTLGTTSTVGTFKYEPNDSFYGTDTFVYQICNAESCPQGSPQATVTITVNQVIEVPVDIKPGSCPNPINVKSRGVLPVAILGTADFDVTQIDPESIFLVIEGDPTVLISPLRFSFEDVGTPFEPFLGKASCEDCNALGPDGYTDLTLKFTTQAIAYGIGVENLTDEQCLVLGITGNLKEEFGGTKIAGEDVVRILKKGNSFGYGRGNGFGFGHGNGFGFGRGKGPKNK